MAPGLLAFSMVNILARAFYALGDIQTPMRISVVCLGLNAIFSFWLIGTFQEAGLGVANTMSAVFNVWLLFYALRRKMSRLDLTLLRQSVLFMSGAAALCGESAWLLSRGWEKWLGHESLVTKIGAVFVPAAGATWFISR